MHIYLRIGRAEAPSVIYFLSTAAPPRTTSRDDLVGRAHALVDFGGIEASGQAEQSGRGLAPPAWPTGASGESAGSTNTPPSTSPSADYR